MAHCNDISNRGPDCCFCETPFTSGVRTCCDPGGDCRRFSEKCRDCFWPFFSHPRWLPCDALYSCCDPCEREAGDPGERHRRHDHD